MSQQCNSHNNQRKREKIDKIRSKPQKEHHNSRWKMRRNVGKKKQQCLWKNESRQEWKKIVCAFTCHTCDSIIMRWASLKLNIIVRTPVPGSARVNQVPYQLMTYTELRNIVLRLSYCCSNIRIIVVAILIVCTSNEYRQFIWRNSTSLDMIILKSFIKFGGKFSNKNYSIVRTHQRKNTRTKKLDQFKRKTMWFC